MASQQRVKLGKDSTFVSTCLWILTTGHQKDAVETGVSLQRFTRLCDTTRHHQRARNPSESTMPGTHHPLLTERTSSKTSSPYNTPEDICLHFTIVNNTMLRPEPSQVGVMDICDKFRRTLGRLAATGGNVQYPTICSLVDCNDIMNHGDGQEKTWKSYAPPPHELLLAEKTPSKDLSTTMS